MKLYCLHDLSRAVHVPDGPGDLHPGVDGRHGVHHELAVVVLHLVLQKGGDADVNVLEEVQDGISAKRSLEVMPCIYHYAGYCTPY